MSSSLLFIFCLDMVYILSQLSQDINWLSFKQCPHLNTIWVSVTTLRSKKQKPLISTKWLTNYVYDTVDILNASSHSVKSTTAQLTRLVHQFFVRRRVFPLGGYVLW